MGIAILIIVVELARLLNEHDHEWEKAHAHDSNKQNDYGKWEVTYIYWRCKIDTDHMKTTTLEGHHAAAVMEKANAN